MFKIRVFNGIFVYEIILIMISLLTIIPITKVSAQCGGPAPGAVCDKCSCVRVTGRCGCVKECHWESYDCCPSNASSCDPSEVKTCYREKCEWVWDCFPDLVCSDDSDCCKPPNYSCNIITGQCEVVSQVTTIL